MNKILLLFTLILAFVINLQPQLSGAFVVTDGSKTYIVDRQGERWEVTEAKERGFQPFYFSYGLGRHAFTPLSDDYLIQDQDALSQGSRVIGVEDEESGGKAFSINRLKNHEVVNSWQNGRQVTVAY